MRVSNRQAVGPSSRRSIADHNDDVPITAVVMTKNERVALPACLISLRSLSQIVVVDSGSTDGTVEIASGAGAEVVQFRWDGGYPKKKQWILDNVDFRNEWVVYVDADERATPELIEEMRRAVAEDTAAAFDLTLDYVFLGRKLRYGHRVVKRALLNRRLCRFPEIDDLEVDTMWEVEGHYQPEVDGTVGSLRTRLLHDDQDPLFGYFSRHNRYSDWEAHLRMNSTAQRQVRRLRTGRGRLFDRAPFKPMVFFAYSYVARGGWRDGREGLDYAIALAFYYWQIDVKTRELAAAQLRKL